jgi:ABC-type glycerol-3-phosphate transport system substrate-binding protein
MWLMLFRYYRDASTYNGQIIGLPLVGQTYSLYYRRDILAAHGYTQAPATWDGRCWEDTAWHAVLLPPSLVGEPCKAE